MKVKIAVTDANIFIDLYNLGLINDFFNLEFEIHTTASVLMELYKEQQEILRAYQSVGKLEIHNLKGEDFIIRYIPRLSITSIVRKLKQESTYHIWRSTHRSFLFKHFWKERTFWSDGYFVCSIGEASPDTIRQYIITQG